MTDSVKKRRGYKKQAVYDSLFGLRTVRVRIFVRFAGRPESAFKRRSPLSGK
jgi:hypothetical protein